jgi:outer membrane protein assembly complex protein YaeT
MSSSSAAGLLALASLASGPDGAASATESYRGRIVRELRLEQTEGLPPEAGRELVDLVVGEPYRPEAVRRSIKQLFALGAFSDIKVEAAPVGPDGVDVLFRLFPRLEVRAVRLEGLEQAGSELLDLRGRLVEESRIKPGDPLELDELEDAAARIGALLRDAGYLWARVEPEASFQSPAAEVVFHVEPGGRARLGTLTIVGVAPHIEADVRSEIGLVPGGPYSRIDLDERIGRLSARWKELGFYGASVSVEESPSADLRVDVRIQPEMGPKVRVEVTGWDFSAKELRKLVPLFAEARFTDDLVEESRANLVEHLVERGYRDAAASLERESLGDGDHLILRFVVEPGLRVEVGAIAIEGLVSVSEADVRALLVTGSRASGRAAPFRQKVWDDDLKAVRAYLERQGFHRARVESREIATPAEAGVVTIVLSISEGPRASIASVELTGVHEVDAQEVIDAARLPPGGPFDAAEVVAARQRVLTYYRNEGFRAAEVQSRATLDAEGKTAAVTFTVREGARTRVDQVIFSGLRATKESAVRRLVTVRAGEPLSSGALLETRHKLIGSGLFESVEIEPLLEDPVTRRSDVLITVKEGPRTTFAYGFGYEESQLARAEFELTRRNVFGLNRAVSVFTRASFRGGRFITTYRQPDTFGYDLPLFVSGYAEQEERTSFDYNRVGVGSQLSKRLSENQTLFLRYRLDSTKVFNLQDVDLDEIDRRFRNLMISAISVASVTDGRDDPLDAKNGQYRILDLEWSATALGTEEPYIKGLAQQFFYFHLPRDMVAAVGMRLGIAKTLREDRDALLPAPERFFAGGATTLRGFALDQASPKRKLVLPNGDVVDGEPIGGNVISLLNIELRFPVLGNLRGVIFSDNGTVYRRLQLIDALDWRYNMGFGFRYDTPLGPLRVDYGFKLDRRTVRSIDCPNVLVPCEESLGRWHITLGHAF